MIELQKKELREALENFKKNGALPQGDVKNALIDIYEANFKKKWGVTKVNRSCPSCISDMMKCLAPELDYVYFQGIPQDAELVALTPEDVENLLPEPYESYSWAQLKSYATKQGINVKGKKKVDILEELKAL